MQGVQRKKEALQEGEAQQEKERLERIRQCEVCAPEYVFIHMMYMMVYVK
jgi:hypothetical protein